MKRQLDFSYEGEDDQNYKKKRPINSSVNENAVRPNTSEDLDEVIPLNATSVQRAIFTPSLVSCPYFDVWAPVNNSLATSKEKFWFSGGALNELKFEDWLVRWLDAYKSTDTPVVMLRDWLDKCEDIDGSLLAYFEVLNLFGSDDLTGFIEKSNYSEGETYVSATLIY